MLIGFKQGPPVPPGPGLTCGTMWLTAFEGIPSPRRADPGQNVFAGCLDRGRRLYRGGAPSKLLASGYPCHGTTLCRRFSIHRLHRLANCAGAGRVRAWKRR